MLAQKLSKNVIKIPLDGNCYLVEGSILIDTSNMEFREELKRAIEYFTDIKKIKKVILTHLHYDHIGNSDLFPDAKFFSSKTATKSMDNKNEKIKFILDPDTAKRFNVKLNDVAKDKELIAKFGVFETPGHCASAITLLYKKDNVLFTGDTYFRKGVFGRVDLPTSDPKEMENSLKKIDELIKKYRPIIAPGHDY